MWRAVRNFLWVTATSCTSPDVDCPRLNNVIPPQVGNIDSQVKETAFSIFSSHSTQVVDVQFVMVKDVICNTEL